MRKKTIPALSKLIAAATSIRNEALDQAIEKGIKIVAYADLEIPVEILTAAGCVPVFLRGTGSEGTEFADAYFRQLTCDYTRHTFNQVLCDQWDFLSGAVFYNHCDHIRRIFDNWKTVKGNPAYHFIYMPKNNVGATVHDFYREEIQKFVAATEQRFGVKITPDRLSAAIKLHNETRALQRELYELQKGESVYLEGSELLLVMYAGCAMPRDAYNLLLRQLIDDLKATGETFTPAIRLLYIGGHADNQQLFELLDSQGGSIVADDAPFGNRLCAADIRTDGDPLEAIIDYYFVEKPAAVRMVGTVDARMTRVDNLLSEYRCEGVVSTRVFMCDLWAFEQFILHKHCEEKGVPSLELEVNYTFDSAGQIRTRVQAFVEQIRATKPA